MGRAGLKLNKTQQRAMELLEARPPPGTAKPAPTTASESPKGVTVGCRWSDGGTSVSWAGCPRPEPRTAPTRRSAVP